MTNSMFDFHAALCYVQASLTPDENEALRYVRIKPVAFRRHAAGLRGCFVGEQARRDPVFDDALMPGARARGQIMIFLRAHAIGDLEALAVTIRHEVDHALGFGETEVLNRAAGRAISIPEIVSYRPFWRGHRVIYPRSPEPAPRRSPPRKRPHLG